MSALSAHGNEKADTEDDQSYGGVGAGAGGDGGGGGGFGRSQVMASAFTRGLREAAATHSHSDSSTSGGGGGSGDSSGGGDGGNGGGSKSKSSSLFPVLTEEKANPEDPQQDSAGQSPSKSGFHTTSTLSCFHPVTYSQTHTHTLIQNLSPRTRS